MRMVWSVIGQSSIRSRSQVSVPAQALRLTRLRRPCRTESWCRHGAPPECNPGGSKIPQEVPVTNVSLNKGLTAVGIGGQKGNIKAIIDRCSLQRSAVPSRNVATIDVSRISPFLWASFIPRGECGRWLRRSGLSYEQHPTRCNQPTSQLLATFTYE